MEFFQRAKTVRLRSHHGKYLVAEDDEEHVGQERPAGSSTSRRARWSVEFVEDINHVVRLRSCYGRYLTPSDEPHLLGVTGKKVVQSIPPRLDSSVEWEPIRDGHQVKLKTRYGNFLRGNGGLPPWRNSVTHDVPHRSSTQDWILWDVEVVEPLPTKKRPPPPSPPPAAAVSSSAATNAAVGDAPSASASGPSLSKLESSTSFAGPVRRVEGRSIFFTVADDNGEVDDSAEWPHLVFNGTSVPELAELLKEETLLSDIIICTRSPLNHQLIPVALQLPPNNMTMRLIVIDADSKVASRFRT